MFISLLDSLKFWFRSTYITNSKLCVQAENLHHLLLIHGSYRSAFGHLRSLIDTRWPIYLFRHHSRWLFDLKSWSVRLLSVTSDDMHHARQRWMHHSIHDRQFITLPTIQDCYSILNRGVSILMTTVSDEWYHASRQRCMDQSIHDRRMCRCD